MLRSFRSGFPRDREQGSHRFARRRRTSLGQGLEPLEGRNLLSSVAGNQAPVLANPGTQFVEEGNRLTFQARATDPDAGQAITYSLDPGAPAGASIDAASGLLVWTPPNVQQTYAITVRATDNGTPSLSDARTLTVMVFDVPPGVHAGVNATLNAGTEFVRVGSFSDPNPDTWSATVDYGDGSGEQPLALNPDHTFRLDHTYTAAGNYTTSITINDSQGGQGRGFFSVQVIAADATHATSGTPQGQSSSSGQIPGTASSGGSNQGAHNSKNPLIVTGHKATFHKKFHIPHFVKSPRHP
jgi:hypothetical protein